MRAQLIERVEQIADRPLAHPLDAVEPKRAVAERRKRRQKPNRRAAVGTEQIGLERGNLAARTVYDQRRAAVARLDLDAQPAEPVDHHPRVFAVERAGERRNAIRQRRANKCPIRDALRSRRPNRARESALRQAEFPAIQSCDGAVAVSDRVLRIDAQISYDISSVSHRCTPTRRRSTKSHVAAAIHASSRLREIIRI